jgi:hypothetical protein
VGKAVDGLQVKLFEKFSMNQHLGNHADFQE